MPAVDPPPGYNFEYPWLNKPHSCNCQYCTLTYREPLTFLELEKPQDTTSPDEQISEGN